MSFLPPDEAVAQCDSDEQYLQVIHHHPEVFAALYFDYEMEPYQAEMLHFARDHQRSLIRVPAQHGKSSLISKVFPVWEIVCNPNIRIVLIMKTNEDTSDYSEQIRNKLADPDEKIVKDFGPFFDPRLTWTTNQFNVAQRQIKDVHYTMEFFGAGGKVLGHRCEIMIVDDVVTEETAKTPGQRSTQSKWFREQVQTGPQYMWTRLEIHPQELKERIIDGQEDYIRWAQHRLGWSVDGKKLVLLKVPEGIYWPTDITYQRVVVCGTTFHPKDLYYELQQDKSYAPLYFDCFTHDPETGEVGALWPAQQPLHALYAERESAGVLSFNKRFRNIALDEGELVFREEMIKGGELDGVEYLGILDEERSWGDYDESWFRTMGHDPASGSTSRFSTWPSYICLGVDQEHNRKMNLIDLFRRQMGIEDIITVLLDGDERRGLPGFWKDYMYQRGLLEANACQRWLLQHHRVLEAIKDGTGSHPRVPVPLEPHYTGSNKWDEVMGMSSIVRYVQNSTYSVPYKYPADKAKAEPLITQLLEFPKGTFDYVMALWFATLAAEAMVQQFESFYLKGHTGRMVTNPMYLKDEPGTEEKAEEVYISDRRRRLMEEYGGWS